MCFNALRRFTITASKASDDRRQTALVDWISGIEQVAGGDLTLASGDASFRRYFRLQKGGESFIVMDAPPPMEDCQPFVDVAGFLHDMNLSVPRVIAANIEDGFLLLTDLGDSQYLDVLTGDKNCAPSLYSDAISALVVMQQRGRASQNELPPYDSELLRFELSLFRDWLCGTHLSLEFTDDDEAAWQSCCDVLVENALLQPQVFVHRDYHSRNLMVLENGNPGILDFQDAVEGPLTYDLVSLLKDCYIRWPEDRIREWALEFYGELDADQQESIGESQFLRFFEMMGVQRQLKAAGIFCRLNHRDGKAAYLEDVPRTLSYILDTAPRYDALKFLQELIENRILPVWKAAA